uniref:Uncharacterized protein n=1 Tax=Trichobilharzia regenti TaxID=157069 RepID=A0AA85IUD1_TRIRE|nr:unnamed protein product [Trichobilharzia regenti]
MPNSRISDQLDMDSLTEVIRGRTSTETASVSSNQLQFTLTDPGNCHIADLPELNLILDKRYFPGLLAMKDERGRREAWCNVASGAAAYAYKTIGSGLSQSVRRWLANAACSAILFSLLGEAETLDESRQNPDFDYQFSPHGGNPDDIDGDDGGADEIVGDDEDDYGRQHDDGDNDDNNGSDWIPPTVRQSDEESPPSTKTYVPDGNWIYGDWTESNIASTEEMETVIQPEMLDDCVRVMIASVICFFREGQHIPHRRNAEYPMQIIQSNMMNRYGVVEECDKLFLMYTTGRWISKLNILTSVMKQWNSRTKVRAVRTFGLGVVYMPEIIIECFHGVPGGWTDVYLVDCIAEKLVKSRCIKYFSDYTSLISHRRLVHTLSNDPIYHHTESKTLTDEKCYIEKANIPCLYGRLITFLKYAEPDSELFTYPQLKIFGETREQYYEDYCAKWESIVKYIYSRDIDSSHVFDSDALDGDLKQFNLVHDCDGNLLNVCFQVYGVHT